MNSSLPVYTINNFERFASEGDFYANDFVTHLRNHHFTKLPHKHDFYLVVLFTKGSGTHEIDFNSYRIKPGSLFILKPGQMHTWKLSLDINGYVFFHTRTFYDEGYTKEKIQNYPFFNSAQNSPYLHLKRSAEKEACLLMSQIIVEYKSKRLLRINKLHALVNLFYITITRLYNPGKQIENISYGVKVRNLESLIDNHFKKLHSARNYASLLNVSEKHLNRMTKITLNKTSTVLISERIILEAQRMLSQQRFTVSEIGASLGYEDVSYFIRFFKKHTGQTPTRFLEKYSKISKL